MSGKQIKGRPAGIVYFYLPWRGQKSVELGYWRVMEKLGMRREGRFVKAIYQDGAFFDDLYYVVLREEYRLT